MGRRLRFEYYYQENLCTKVFVDYTKQTVEVENYTDDIISQAFGRRNISIESIDEFFRERVFPETRVNCKELLGKFGFRNFDAEAIARRTHGILVNDLYWLRFDDEEFGWEDVKMIRKEIGCHC